MSYIMVCKQFRALENFHITGKHLDHDFIIAFGNGEKSLCIWLIWKQVDLNISVGKPLFNAADEVIAGQILRINSQ